MKTFVWNRYFETGLLMVDDQHRALVALINRLGESFLAGDAVSEAKLRALFTELASYAGHHFSDEERLMREANLAPEYLARHHEVHAHFTSQLAELWSARATMSNAGEIVLGFLVAWLGFHILGEDMLMASQVAAIRGGASPVAALAQAEERRAQDAGAAALIDALKALYHTLSVQNRELANANQRLEQRVEERTRELSAANARLEDLARVDGLLGIANRRCFDERFNEEWLRARRARTPLAILMIDVDHFKPYNDTHGHQAGDDCLRAVAKCVAVAGAKRPGDLLARYGGEELVILLSNTALAGGAKVALDVCEAVEKARIPHGTSPVSGHVTVSVGVAAEVPPTTATSGAELILAADRALYAAKEQGRNRIVSRQG